MNAGDFLSDLDNINHDIEMRWSTYAYWNMQNVSLNQLSLVHEFKSELNITLLMMAARQGLTDIIELLIMKGIPIDDEDDFYRTALVHAVECGRTNAVRTLLRLGANCKSINYPNSLFCTPILSGDFEIVAMLLDAYATSYPENKGGDNFLFQLACQSRDMRVADLLFTKRAINIDYQTSNGFTALYWSVVSKSEIIHLLLSKQVNVNILSPHGLTMLELAREIKNQHAEILLKSAGALETRSREGKELFLKLTQELVLRMGTNKLGQPSEVVMDKLKAITSLTKLRTVLRRIQNITTDESNQKWENLVM